MAAENPSKAQNYPPLPPSPKELKGLRFQSLTLTQARNLLQLTCPYAALAERNIKATIAQKESGGRG